MNRQERRAAERQALKQARKASQAQINANRENATHSTGPRSEAGKATVSQNRTTHGLNYNAATFRPYTEISVKFTHRTENDQESASASR